MVTSREFSLNVLLVFIFLVLASFVFAEQVIVYSDLNQSVTLNQSFEYTLNISVNNTDNETWANITQMNITLPSGLLFVNGNGTSVEECDFTNTSDTLSWFNEEGLIMNSSLRFFWFKVKAISPGTYYLNLTLLNSTGAYTSNLSVIVLERIFFTLPTFGSESNNSKNYIEANVSVNGDISQIDLYLYNESGGQINWSNSTTSPLYANFSGLSDGRYFINATVNDSLNNVLNTSTRRIVLDSAAPSLDLSESGDTETDLTISVDSSDATSGVLGCTKIAGPGTLSASNTSISAEELDCDTYYFFNVSCVDYAGNVVYDSLNASTEECDDDDEDDGGSGGGTTTNISFWSVTYPYDSQELRVRGAVTKALGTKERARLKINSETHYVGVIRVNSTSVTFNVSSTPQQATLKIGISQKFDVDDDEVYDLLVQFASYSSSRATLVMSAINESVNQTDIVSDSSPNVTTTQTVNHEQEEGNAGSGEGAVEKKKGSIPILSIVLIIVIVAVVVAFSYYWTMIRPNQPPKFKPHIFAEFY